MEGLEQRLGNQDSANRHFAEYKLILFGPTCCDDEQEHLRADDEAPAGLQDADEEAGAGGQRQPYQPQPHQPYQSNQPQQTLSPHQPYQPSSPYHPHEHISIAGIIISLNF